MADIPNAVVPVDPELSQPLDDGRGRPIQELIDAWVTIPRDERRQVLRGLWWAEQKATERAEDMTVTGDTGKRRRNDARRRLKATRAARWLLRELANALDPVPAPERVCVAPPAVQP